MAGVLWGEAEIYHVELAIVLPIIVCIFYKIFVNSLTVITEFGKKTAFSVEEVIGASLLVSVAFSALAGLSIFNLSITNILSIMVVLFLGWKNGILARTGQLE